MFNLSKPNAKWTKECGIQSTYQAKEFFNKSWNSNWLPFDKYNLMIISIPSLQKEQHSLLQTINISIRQIVNCLINIVSKIMGRLPENLLTCDLCLQTLFTLRKRLLALVDRWLRFSRFIDRNNSFVGIFKKKNLFNQWQDSKNSSPVKMKTSIRYYLSIRF